MALALHGRFPDQPASDLRGEIDRYYDALLRHAAHRPRRPTPSCAPTLNGPSANYRQFDAR